MKCPLRILHLKAELPHDAALIDDILEAEGFTFETSCVHTLDDFKTAIDRGGIDLVFTHFSMPASQGLAAIGIVRHRRPELPIIMVSRSLDEKWAIASLKDGATDYVLREQLGRLGPAVRRAMEEVEERSCRRRLETQFIKAQKTDVIGNLAVGIAHDFNNILGVIMGCNERMMTELAPDSPLRKYAEEIQDASERAAGLTRQLLVFSRGQTVCPVVLYLEDVIKDLDIILRRLIDENITLTMSLENRTGPVKADPGYIGQVLMNLVVNARDAMPQGGNLNISTENVTVDDEEAGKLPDAVPGDYVMLCVRDTGLGMTDEVKERLFEAFFTTKPEGKGTGLGLPTCQAVVQKSGGYIAVESEPGKGSTFKVFIPRVEEGVKPKPAPVEPESPLPRGTETLLVVEDEPAVRHIARGLLRAQGYNVLTASNGQEGLHAVRDHKGSTIRLVLTDVIMPLMGGKVMAEWLKATYPDIKILYTSGYTDDAIAQYGVLEPGVDFLAKPYTRAALVRKVRQMLDEDSQSVYQPAENAHFESQRVT